ncbi:MAG: hypothetical protein GWP10_10295, partial [Nitrospiraceae bacterium]|nr:hypothetical protein [Nitrospiraceae bacterium]
MWAFGEYGEDRAAVEDGTPLNTKLNPVERAIIVVAAYSIAILAVVLLYLAWYRPAALIFGAFAVPLILGASFLRFSGGLLLGLGTALIGIPFLGFNHPGLIVGLVVTDLAIGGGIGWLNRRSAVRRERWRRAKTLQDGYEQEIFENSLNILHFIDYDQRREGLWIEIGNRLKRPYRHWVRYE